MQRQDGTSDTRTAGTLDVCLRAVACALAAGTIVASLATGAAAGDSRTRCAVGFQVGELPEATAIGLLDFSFTYVRPKIFPPDAEGRVRCHGFPAGSAVAATNVFNNSQSGTVTVAFASASGAPASTQVLECEVYSAGASFAVPEDFPVISVIAARSITLAPIDPLPVISVGQIRCGDAATTTTTSTTTTTLPATTTTTEPPATTTTLPTTTSTTTTLAPGTTTTLGPDTTTTTEPPATTTTTLPPEICSVHLRLASTGNYRRIRFELDYSGADGLIPTPIRGSCAGVGNLGLGTLPDAQARRATMDTVAVGNIDGPVVLVACDFLPGGGIPQSADFDVTILQASDSTGAPASQVPVVAATNVMCPSLTTTTTSTTTTLPPPLCGDADGDGEIEASDALATLKEAVGLDSVCTLARCDVDSSGSVLASDALAVLRAAVGSDVTLDCPD